MGSKPDMRLTVGDGRKMLEVVVVVVMREAAAAEREEKFAVERERSPLPAAEDRDRKIAVEAISFLFPKERSSGDRDRERYRVRQQGPVTRMRGNATTRGIEIRKFFERGKRAREMPQQGETISGNAAIEETSTREVWETIYRRVLISP